MIWLLEKSLFRKWDYDYNYINYYPSYYRYVGGYEVYPSCPQLFEVIYFNSRFLYGFQESVLIIFPLWIKPKDSSAAESYRNILKYSNDILLVAAKGVWGWREFRLVL